MKTIFSCGLSLCVLFFFSNLALAEDGPFAFGDLNCSGAANVVDVVLSVNMALGIPMSEDLDANGDGFPDACLKKWSVVGETD